MDTSHPTYSLIEIRALMELWKKEILNYVKDLFGTIQLNYQDQAEWVTKYRERVKDSFY